jgi:hypothetical protein
MQSSIKIINQYACRGEFSFKKDDKLNMVSSKLPETPGVYIFSVIKDKKEEVVYIGKSGTLEQNGCFKKQFLRKRLNNKQDGLKRQDYFERKIEIEELESIKVYWAVTFDENNSDLPAFVEANLLQLFFRENMKLPRWNKSF